MNTVIESLKSFLPARIKFFKNGEGLKVKQLESALIIVGNPDERIGSWVEHYKSDLIAFKEENNVDMTVLVEESDQLESPAFVYVIISKPGDNTSLNELKKIEKGRKGVHYFDITKLPSLEEFTNYSALTRILNEKCSVVLDVE